MKTITKKLRGARMTTGAIPCVLFAGCALALAAPATAFATPINTSPPTISGFDGFKPPSVGSPLYCNGGLWSSNGTGSPYVQSTTWYQDTPSGAQVATNSTYTPLGTDIGHTLVCKVTAYDSSDNTTASVVSAPTATVLPDPSVTVTQYSSTVRGNIGETKAGVIVTTTLKRPPTYGGTTTDVRSATAATDATGAWSVNLTPLGINPGYPGDEIAVHYAPPAGQSITVPDDTTYSSQPTSMSISPDGASITGPSSYLNCTLQSVVINGVTQATTTLPNGQCSYSPNPVLTDQDHVQAATDQSYRDQTNGSASTLTMVSDLGLLGVSQGPPTCTGDLVSGQVVCSNLNADTFAVSRNGGAAVPLATAQGQGSPTYQGSAVLPGLSSGDVITLDETGALATTRHLTTLHVNTLRADVGPQGDASGACEPNKPLGFHYAEASAVCPSSGRFSGLQGYGGLAQVDDLSGGATVLNVPSLANHIPTSDGSVPAGAFTAYADVTGTGTTGQVLTQTKSVNLQIVPRGANTAVVNQNAAPASDSVGPYVTANVGPLSSGRYYANWLLTDSHGDTVVYSDLFAVQPTTAGTQGPAGPPGPTGPAGPAGATGPGGATGAQGPGGAAGPQGPAGATGATGPQGPGGAQGVAGPQGPAGKNGTSYEVKCAPRTTGSGKHRKTAEVCTVSVLSPGSHLVSVDISRGSKRYAVGTSLVHAGRAKFSLRSVHAMKRARYLVTVVVTHGKRSTVHRSRQTIQ